MKWNFKIGFPNFLVWAWVLMIVLGNIHQLVPSVPALGYITCVLIALLFMLVPWDSILQLKWEEK